MRSKPLSAKNVTAVFSSQFSVYGKVATSKPLSTKGREEGQLQLQERQLQNVKIKTFLSAEPTKGLPLKFGPQKTKDVAVAVLPLQFFVVLRGPSWTKGFDVAVDVLRVSSRAFADKCFSQFIDN